MSQYHLVLNHSAAVESVLEEEEALLRRCCPACVLTCRDAETEEGRRRENGEIWSSQTDACRKCQCKVRGNKYPRAGYIYDVPLRGSVHACNDHFYF